MPSALIEIGFISNREEEKYIASEKGQNEIAQAIVSAIGEYKKRWAKMQDGATAQAASKPSAKPDNVAAKSSASSTTPAAERLPARPTSLATYHIQIFSTSRILKNNSREFKGLKGAAYYRSGKSYRYYVGSYSTEKDANKSLREVKTKFPDAFVVKLRNGKPE